MAKDIGLGKPGITTETKSGINCTWALWIDGKKLIEDTPSIFITMSVTISTAAAMATYG